MPFVKRKRFLSLVRERERAYAASVAMAVVGCRAHSARAGGRGGPKLRRMSTAMRPGVLSRPTLEAIGVAQAVHALARAKGELWIVSTTTLPPALRRLLPNVATAAALDRAAWPAPLGAPAGLPAPTR